MRQKRQWTIPLASAVILFFLGITLTIVATITYNNVTCNGQIMHPGDLCIHYDIYGNATSRITLDQERQNGTIFQEILGAMFFFGVGIFSLVCTFKTRAPNSVNARPQQASIKYQKEHNMNSSDNLGINNVGNNGPTQGQVNGDNNSVTVNYYGKVQEEHKSPLQTPSKMTPVGSHPKRPATVFLSYNEQNADEVAILERELKLRGVKPWRDVADLAKGSPIKDEIADAIAHQTDALLIYLTPESLASSFVWEIAIPAALERHQRDHSFRVIPVLRGVTPSEVQSLCTFHGLRSLKDFHFDILPDPQLDQAAFNEKRRKLANEILKAALGLRLRRVQADDNYEPSICLHTFKEDPSPAYLDLDLNWYDLFLGRDLLPSQAEWQEILLPALLDVKDTLGELHISRRLHISLQSILPAAFALGSTFPATTSFTLLPANQNEEWCSKGSIPSSSPLRLISYDENGDSRVAIVKIAITQPVTRVARDVSNYLRLLDLSAKYHLQFDLLEGPDHTNGVKDAVHALAISHQIGKELRGLCGKGVTQIHIFAAIPAALAVLIGHQFNTICPVTVYEYNRLDGIYKLACTVQAQ